jgi:hypothetical protein
VAKYNTNGNLLWIKQFGTGGDDSAYSIATDSKGNVYLTGWTDGDLGSPNAGSWDAWVAKYDTNGNLLWTNQLGTPSADTTYDGVDTDSLGNVYISGWTEGNLGGENTGSLDAFVAKYDSKGNFIGTRQLGSAGSDKAYGLDFNSTNTNFYLAGWTNGDLGGKSAGGLDAWVAKYNTKGDLFWTEQLGTSSSGTSYDIENTGESTIPTSSFPVDNSFPTSEPILWG